MEKATRKCIKKARLSTRQGFTLLELLVAVTIIAIVAAMSFSLLKDRRKEEDVNVATRRIAGLISESQNSALNGRMQPNVSGVLEGVCNYFITMENIGNNIKVNSSFNRGGTPLDCSDGTNEIETETIIKNVQFDDSPPKMSNRKIKFSIPAGKVTVTGPSNPVLKIKISSTKDPNIKGTVCVYKFSGKIEEVIGSGDCPS